MKPPIHITFLDGGMRPPAVMAASAPLEFAFDPSEPRDDDGKWTSTGGQPRLAPLESGKENKQAGMALPYEMITMKGLPKDIQKKVMEKVRNEVASTQKINASFDHFMEVAWNTPALKEDGTPEIPLRYPIREDGMTWYQRTHDLAVNIAEENGLDLQNVAAAFASMSPGQQWNDEADILRGMASLDRRDVNMSEEKLSSLNEKMDVYGFDHVQNGDAYSEMGSRQAVISMQSQFMEQDMGSWGIGYGYGNFSKALDLMRGQDPDETLSGPKVRSFTNNIVDPSDPRDVTIDVHMVQGSARDPAVVNDSGVMSSPALAGASIGIYPYIADVVRRVADDYKILPNQAQALIWLGYKGEYGKSANTNG